MAVHISDRGTDERRGTRIASATGTAHPETFGRVRREYDASESGRAISRVQTLNVVEMRAEPCGHGVCQHDASVLLSLAAPDCELATIEVHILDAKLETFLEAEAGAI